MPQSLSLSTTELKSVRRFIPQLAQLLLIGFTLTLILHSWTFLQPNTPPETNRVSATVVNSDRNFTNNTLLPKPIVHPSPVPERIVHPSPVPERIVRPSPPPEHNVRPLSVPERNVSAPPIPERVVRAPFYLKLHKTGSTTIAHYLFWLTRKKKLSTLRAPGNIYVSTLNPTTQKCDAIVGHHVVFNLTVIRSYMYRNPDLLLTSIRLPLQRQVSWFRQQNKDLGEVSCDKRDEKFLSYFDEWYPKRIAPQYNALQEANSKEQLNGDVEKILDQFDFVFVKERLKQSFECFCEKTGIRLCSKEMPMVSKNVRGPSCVEKQLLKYRSEALLKGHERDLLIYEAAGRRLDCRASDWCRCPTSL